jgi:(+)-trans-carveol dehydrogenase
MPQRVTGKVAFITGAARGQGRSHAISLAREGADIIAFDLCADVASVPYGMATVKDLDETVAHVRALGRRIVPFVGDVRELGSVEKAAQQGFEELGRIDIVCANAGIATNMSAGSLAMDSQMWQEMIDINLTGVWHTCKAAVPFVQRGGRGGSIVLTTSFVAHKPMANIGHYVAAKAGVLAFAKSLAKELAGDFIRVNCISPSNVETPMIMNESVFRLFLGDRGESSTVEDFAAASQATNALPIPWVQPEDISNAVLFFASEESRYVTGAVLAVDAGASIT